LSPSSVRRPRFARRRSERLALNPCDGGTEEFPGLFGGPLSRATAASSSVTRACSWTTRSTSTSFSSFSSASRSIGPPAYQTRSTQPHPVRPTRTGEQLPLIVVHVVLPGRPEGGRHAEVACRPAAEGPAGTPPNR